MRILSLHHAHLFILCISKQLPMSSNNVTPTSDCRHFWNVIFYMCSIFVISFWENQCIRLTLNQGSTDQLLCPQNVRPDSKSALLSRQKLWLGWLGRGQRYFKRIPNAFQARCKCQHIVNTRINSFLKLPRFWKKSLSSSRAFAISLSTQIFLQGRLP